MSVPARVLVHPLLAERGVRHGFGVRGAEPPDDLWRPRQVHGSTLVVAEGKRWSEPPAADAVAASRPGRAVGVVTADCVPVLLASARGEWVLAVHAGWRGLAAGVVEATVRALDCEPGSLVAWLGPSIGPDAFEVGPEVRAALLARDPGAAAAFRAGRADRLFADLPVLAWRRLAAAGVSAVHGGGLCTHAEPALFYSYRRDGATGRMAALAWLE